MVMLAFSMHVGRPWERFSASFHVCVFFWRFLLVEYILHTPVSLLRPGIRPRWLSQWRWLSLSPSLSFSPHPLPPPLFFSTSANMHIGRIALACFRFMLMWVHAVSQRLAMRQVQMAVLLLPLSNKVPSHCLSVSQCLPVCLSVSASVSHWVNWQCGIWRGLWLPRLPSCRGRRCMTRWRWKCPASTRLWPHFSSTTSSCQPSSRSLSDILVVIYVRLLSCYGFSFFRNKWLFVLLVPSLALAAGISLALLDFRFCIIVVI